MGTVYVVVNQKGGVGKTTTAVNVAACLAIAGQRVLLVDLDPQGHATTGVGVDKRTLSGAKNSAQKSTYDVLVNESPLSEALLCTGVPNLTLVPANLELAGAEVELMPRMIQEPVQTLLRSALAPVRDHFDFIFIDAPPSLGLLTVNGMVAADRAIIPIQCEYYALEGVSQLLNTVERIRRKLNPALEIGMVIMTMYDNRIRLAQQVVEEVRQVFQEKVSRTIVPRNVRLSEAPSHGLPVAIYDPRSRGASAYRDIAQEIVRNGKKRVGERP
jgi:chromosome partitioning protein